MGSAREIRRPLRRPRTALLRRDRRRTRRRFAGDDRRSVGQSRDRLPRGLRLGAPAAARRPRAAARRTEMGGRIQRHHHAPPRPAEAPHREHPRPDALRVSLRRGGGPLGRIAAAGAVRRNGVHRGRTPSPQPARNGLGTPGRGQPDGDPLGGRHPRGADDGGTDGAADRGGRGVRLPHRPDHAEPRTQRQAREPPGGGRRPLLGDAGHGEIRRGGRLRDHFVLHAAAGDSCRLRIPRRA